MPSVLQEWVMNLSYMQQSVLITGCRGPDGLHKDHVSKVLLRWLRRCFLLSAFEGKVLTSPYEKGGGSFTGPCSWPLEEPNIDKALEDYLRSVDEVPHHFHLHLMHSAEIVGRKHPDERTRKWWLKAYCRMVNDMRNWRAAEEVVAK